MPIFLKLTNFRFLLFHSRHYSYTAYSNLINLLNTMPKEQGHISEMQKQRKKIREKVSKYVPGTVRLQVLGSGAKGAPRALYMFSDQSRYLFNCGEGTQRLAHEHKMKLSKLEHIFITQPVWKNIGGLPGTALTIQDVGVPHITLHGPEGLEEIFIATKRFVIIKDLHIRMAECTETSTFEDNVMTVKYVPLVRSSDGVPSDDDAFEEEEFEDDNNSKITQMGTAICQANASTSTRREGPRRRRRRRSNSRTNEDVEDNTDYYAHERKRSRNRRRSRSRSQSSDSGSRVSPEFVTIDSQQKLQETKEKGISMAFICKLHPRPGALNLDKCVKLGVPPGPLLGRLKGGEDITLPNGTVVCSKDVCDPDEPGPVFIVVDCPTDDYLDSLIINEQFKQHQRSAKYDEDMAYVVVHFTPKDIMDTPRYKKWIEDFSPSTLHLVLNENNTCMGSLSVHRIQYKMNMLSEDFFPLLGDKGTQIVEEPADLPSSKRLKGDSSNVDVELNGSAKSIHNIQNLTVRSRPTSPMNPYIFANTFCSIHLRPKLGLDTSAELKIVPTEYVEETLNIESFPDTLHDLKESLVECRNDIPNIRKYPKLIFLGTGSCIPNKTRNTSGILLETCKNQYILMDCGEGTYGQLVRYFGPEVADEVVTNVNAIYVSHLHADHHIGLLGVLQGRRNALNSLKLEREPIKLLAPKQILTWLNFYDRCFENIREEFELIPNGELLMNNESNFPQILVDTLYNKLGMKDIRTCYVKHCPNAFGVAFTHKDGYKITYSGDTMPCDPLIELGKNSDILIHEATMEDELAHEAVVKMHSTTSQAIEIGRRMEAKNIILTHFSQRYAKLPRFNDNFTDNVSIAFDNMQIRLGELPLVPHLYPALKLMFAEHYEEMENKAVKRERKVARERSASLERSLDSPSQNKLQSTT